MRQLSLFEAAREGAPLLRDDKLITDLAAEAIEQLDLHPPIDERVVASYHGVLAIRLADIPWAGCLIPLDRGPVIQIRATDARSRQRFTALHEVSHTFFPGFERVTRYRCDPGSHGKKRDREELLCDIAASEMLLPRRWFEPDLDQSAFGIDLVRELSGRYLASLEATARRLVDLWPEPALCVILEDGTKPSESATPGAETKLRVRYSHGSGDWPYVPRFKSVARGSALEAARLGDVVEAVSHLDGLVAPTQEPLQLSARLFPYRDSSGNDRRRVIALYRRMVRLQPVT